MLGERKLQMAIYHSVEIQSEKHVTTCRVRARYLFSETHAIKRVIKTVPEQSPSADDR